MSSFGTGITIPSSLNLVFIALRNSLLVRSIKKSLPGGVGHDTHTGGGVVVKAIVTLILLVDAAGMTVAEVTKARSR